MLPALLRPRMTRPQSHDLSDHDGGTMGTYLTSKAIRCTSSSANLCGATDVSSAVERAPADGDAAICINCGHLMTYDGGGSKLRNPTDAELSKFNSDADVLAALAAVGRHLGARA